VFLSSRHSLVRKYSLLQLVHVVISTLLFVCSFLFQLEGEHKFMQLLMYVQCASPREEGIGWCM